ncbi:CABYR protein, partial [Psilopogon haemacephalus]|nr:CABYR protein [Psilopogon haemacephalus]
EEMSVTQTRLVVPYGLTTLLEGVSRAAVVNHPEDIADFFTLYFQGLAAFRRGFCAHVLPSVPLADAVSEGGEELSETSVPCEDWQRDKCTDTEEDQLLEEHDTHYSSTVPQHPSSSSSFAESTISPASKGAETPMGAVLAYVPAEPAMLATHLLGNRSSSCSLRDVATSVQTLPTTSQASEDECMPGGGSEAASDISHLSLRDAATSVQTLPM